MNGNSGFPFFPWDSCGNGNGHGVILERELLHGNGREWEVTTVAKFPHNTTVSVTQSVRLECNV